MSVHFSDAHVSLRKIELPHGAKISPSTNQHTFEASKGKKFEPSVLALRLAETAADRNAAAALLNRRFAWRGYGEEHEIPSSENHTTFIALLDNNIVGTITLGVDSGSGLAIDSVFADEIAAFRAAPGSQVCELTKFAFETGLPDQQNLAMLFHTVFLYGLHNYDCTDLFIEVNPRHRRFYQAMLGFTPIGDMRMNESVAAPSQLMWLNVSQIAASIATHRSAVGKSRSLYSLFLTQKEETAVAGRLKLRRKGGAGLGTNLIERSLQV